MKVAILVDGSYFIKRYRALYANWRDKTPVEVARDLYAGLLRDMRKVNQRSSSPELYRIFFYDCPPLEKRLQNPISKKGITMGETAEAKFRKSFHEELKHHRKVALRLGRVADDGHWVIIPGKTKELLNGRICISDLTENDVKYDVRQKGVDMRIGLDIASLAYKKAVDQIILIAGDSDFVPAAKLARREGIDFVLDPMWNNINPDLYEHIDGLCSAWQRPETPFKQRQTTPSSPAGLNSKPATHNGTISVSIEVLLKQAITETKGGDGFSRLADIGNYIRTSAPGFSYKNHGFEKLIDLVKAQNYLQVLFTDDHPKVQIAEEPNRPQED